MDSKKAEPRGGRASRGVRVAAAAIGIAAATSIGLTAYQRGLAAGVPDHSRQIAIAEALRGTSEKYGTRIISFLPDYPVDTARLSDLTQTQTGAEALKTAANILRGQVTSNKDWIEIEPAYLPDQGPDRLDEALRANMEGKQPPPQSMLAILPDAARRAAVDPGHIALSQLPPDVLARLNAVKDGPIVVLANVCGGQEHVQDCSISLTPIMKVLVRYGSTVWIGTDLWAERQKPTKGFWVYHKGPLSAVPAAPTAPPLPADIAAASVTVPARALTLRDVAAVLTKNIPPVRFTVDPRVAERCAYVSPGKYGAGALIAALGRVLVVKAVPLQSGGDRVVHFSGMDNERRNALLYDAMDPLVPATYAPVIQLLRNNPDVGAVTAPFSVDDFASFRTLSYAQLSPPQRALVDHGIALSGVKLEPAQYALLRIEPRIGLEVSGESHGDVHSEQDTSFLYRDLVYDGPPAAQ